MAVGVSQPVGFRWFRESGGTIIFWTVFVMIVIEGAPGEEVAAALGLPLATVWTRLHHARRELREHLKESES